MTRSIRSTVLLAVFGFTSALGGCASTAPRIPFNTASEADLAKSKSEEVWYEFHPGDEVPIALLYTGLIEAKSPVKAVAKKPFWLVIRPSSPALFSFDGKSIAASPGQAGMMVGREGNTNFVGVLVHMGAAEDAPAELKR